MTARPRQALLVVCAVVLVGLGVFAGANLFPRTVLQQVEPSSVDVGFSQDMIVHHQQAVEMARIVAGRAGERVDALAAAMADSQLREIGHMQGWLDAWGAPQVASEPMAWMAGEHGGHDGDTPMPGMASTKELDRLRDLTGSELDVLFLQLMIRHHQGGVDMARAAARDARFAQVRAMAERIALDQQQEIAAMAAHLDELGAKPLPSR